MADGQTVVVVGGGAIGLCAAYFLRLAGADVTVLEKNRCGSGASHGNAGWIVPSLSAPMPAPGLTYQTLKWVGRADSPVYIRPRLDAQFITWMWRFWRACSQQAHDAGLGALARLNNSSMELFDQLADDGVVFRMYRSGLVFAFLEEDSALAELSHLQTLRPYGMEVPDHVLTGDALRKIEPALAQAVHSGFFLDTERHVDPRSLMGGLVARLQEMGVAIHEGTEVLDVDLTGQRVTSLRTTSGRYEADVLLLAAGVETSRLAGLLGCRIPLEGGKGYSFSVLPTRMPAHALYLGEAKVGCSPLDGHLRIAGTMELSGINLRLDDRRIQAMVRAARQYLVDWPEGSLNERWTGLRPMTPDGLPIIDRLEALQNVYVSTGHNTLGITLAPASGHAMSDFIRSSQRPAVLQPFTAARF